MPKISNYKRAEATEYNAQFCKRNDFHLSAGSLQPEYIHSVNINYVTKKIAFNYFETRKPNIDSSIYTWSDNLKATDKIILNSWVLKTFTGLKLASHEVYYTIEDEQPVIHKFVVDYTTVE